MKLALVNKLKKKSHKDVAFLQDVLVGIIYDVFPKAVIHGSTSVWRCYGGLRFSEGIDVYLKRPDESLTNKFKKKVSEKGLALKKFKTSENAIYSKIYLGNIEVRFEASFFGVENAVLGLYETVGSNQISVLTLTPENLVMEKVNAYLSRRLIRDIYDIYILLGKVDESQSVKTSLRKLLTQYKKPLDSDILPSLIFMGAVPNEKQIMDSIRKWAK